MNHRTVRSDISTMVVLLGTQFFWDVSLCSWVNIYQYFKGISPSVLEYVGITLL